MSHQFYEGEWGTREAQLPVQKCSEYKEQEESLFLGSGCLGTTPKQPQHSRFIMLGHQHLFMELCMKMHDSLQCNTCPSQVVTDSS